MIRFHHMRQQPVQQLNQTLRFYRPFTGTGLGVVVLRHEFSVVWGSR